MIDLDIGMITLLLFLGLFIVLMMGQPLAFVLGGLGVLFTLLFWQPSSIYLFVAKIWGAMNSFPLIAIPLFVLMAAILQESGVAEDLIRMMYQWTGAVRGGLAVGAVFVAAIIAAMTGINATGTVTLGMFALPHMMKYKYDKELCVGSIMAGGSLGVLIPPSVLFIIFAIVSQVSIGRLFMAGIVPGLLLVLLFTIYILVISFLKPNLAPSLPKEERPTWTEKVKGLRYVLLPLLIIIAVLGSIYGGIASVSESAGMGVLGTIVAAAIHRRLNVPMLKKSAESAFRMTVMCMWILFGSFTFAAVYQGLGASGLINDLMVALPGGKWGAFIFMQLSFFVLGCFLDPVGIIMITAPIFVPLAKSLGFDPIWYGVIYVMNMQIAYLTPPFGFNLFWMKAVAPKSITIENIYRSVIPFVILQAIGLIICTIFPEIVTFLPDQMMAAYTK